MKFLPALIFTLLLIAAAFVSNAAAQAEDAPEDIKRFISAEEKAQKVPVEINKLIYGDIGGNAKKDIVIQYNVQIGFPGNNFLSYIAVFVNKNGKYVFTARMENGAKLASVLVPNSVKNKVIIFDKYAPQGFEKIGTAKYKLVGRKLVKL
jgi:hypothetical protein